MVFSFKAKFTLNSQVREIGAMLQLLPLILVPFVAVVQSCRYMLYVDSAEVSISLHFGPALGCVNYALVV